MSVVIYPIGKFDVSTSEFDNCTFEIGIVSITEGMKIGDSTTKGITKTLSDGAIIGETFLKTNTFFFRDGIKLGETVVKTVTKILTSNVAIGEVAVTNTIWHGTWVTIVDLWTKVSHAWSSNIPGSGLWTKLTSGSGFWTKDSDKTSSFTKASSGSGPTWTK